MNRLRKKRCYLKALKIFYYSYLIFVAENEGEIVHAMPDIRAL